MLIAEYATHELSQWPCSRLRLVIRTMASSPRCRSTTMPFGKSSASTAMVARQTGSVIAGRAISSAGDRPASRRRISRYSCRTSASLGCAVHTMPTRARNSSATSMARSLLPTMKYSITARRTTSAWSVRLAARSESSVSRASAAASSPRDDLALGAAELELEREPVATAPAALPEERAAGGEVGLRGGVGGRGHRALARDEVELRDDVRARTAMSIAAAPRSNWLTISKMFSSSSAAGVSDSSTLPIRRCSSHARGGWHGGVAGLLHAVVRERERPVRRGGSGRRPRRSRSVR